MRLRTYPDRLKIGAVVAEKTAEEQRGRPFRTGVSGNSASRPPGSRKAVENAPHAQRRARVPGNDILDWWRFAPPPGLPLPSEAHVAL